MSSSSTCQHVFISTYLSKPVPTFCDYCKKIIWVFQGKVRNCRRCNLFYHEDCFHEVLLNVQQASRLQRHAEGNGEAEFKPQATKRGMTQQSAENVQENEKGGSEPEPSSFIMVSHNEEEESVNTKGNSARSSFDNVSVDGVTNVHTDQTTSAIFTHHHVLMLKTYYTPTFCSVCKGLLVGIRKQGLECLECEFNVHEKCVAQLSKGAVVLDKDGGIPQQHADLPEANNQVSSPSSITRSVALAQQIDPNKDAAFSNVLHMLSVFNERNKKWAFSAFNPVTMFYLHKRHMKLFEAGVAALPGASESKSEIQKYSDVLRYATAVYGKAYEDGYFASCGANFMMRVMNPGVVSSKHEVNNQAVANILSLPRSSIRFAVWDLRVYEPSYCIIVDDLAKSIVLAFRGSISDADFLTDAAGETRDNWRNSGASVHAGISKMIDSIYDNGEPIKVLQDLLTSHPSYEFLVTGHSLGAALTCLFCLRAITEKTFGDEHVPKGFAYAPPPTVTKPVADQFDDHISCLVTAHDCVPRLQYNAFDRLCAEMSGDGANAGESAEGSPKDSSSSASVTQNLADLTEEAHIIGKVRMISNPKNVKGATRLVAIPRGNVLLHQIFVSGHMIQNHLMDHYGEGLQRVLEGL